MPTVVCAEKGNLFSLRKFGATNKSLSVSFKPFRAAARQGQHHLTGGWCRSPTAHFCPHKSVQKALRGHPLKSPILRESPLILVRFFGTQFAKRESFAPLTRYKLLARKAAPFLWSALCFVSSLCSLPPVGRGDWRRPRQVVGAKIRRLVALKQKCGKSETKEVSAIFWVLFNRLKSTSPGGEIPPFVYRQ